jgi:hypothetical protein
MKVSDFFNAISSWLSSNPVFRDRSTPAMIATAVVIGVSTATSNENDNIQREIDRQETITIGINECNNGYIGETIDNNKIFIGCLFDGVPRFVLLHDLEGKYYWNDGNPKREEWYVTGAKSQIDGASNSENLVVAEGEGVTHIAAQMCLSYGAEWYLPSIEELGLLYYNRTEIEGLNSGKNQMYNYYWSSTEVNDELALRWNFNYRHNNPNLDVNTTPEFGLKGAAARVRCFSR